MFYKILINNNYLYDFSINVYNVLYFISYLFIILFNELNIDPIANKKDENNDNCTIKTYIIK